MTSYIFFHIDTDKLDEYNDATIYHSTNNWTIPILFKNCDFYINYEDIQYRFYYINTSDNIQFKIKNKDTYILLNDSKFLTFNDNGNINNIIITTEENNLYNGINHINIHDNMIKIFKNQFILFEGYFEKGKNYVKGILYYDDDNFLKKYEGEWYNGKMNGHGIYYNNNNMNMKLYEGNYVDDKYDGFGILYYRSGSECYKGYFVNGKRNGKGISYNESGKFWYEGEWQDDKHNGKGMIYHFWSGNIKQEGFFENGKFIDGI